MTKYCGSWKALHRMGAAKLEDDAKHQKVRTPQNVWESWTNNSLSFPENYRRIEKILKFRQDKRPEISTRTPLIYEGKT